jgi:hypothetical protein
MKASQAEPSSVPAELKAEDATLAVLVDSGGHEGGHVHHPAAITDLDGGGIQPEAGVGLTDQGAVPEGLDLAIERATHTADLTCHRPSCSPSSWSPKSNDVRMTRWPLPFLATPLLHQL